MVTGPDGSQREGMLDTPLPGLHATPPEPLPFAPSLHIRGFVLEREHGNLLVYAAPGVRAAAPAIESLGGVTRQYLNHWHEAAIGGDGIDAALAVHAADRAETEASLPVDETYALVPWAASGEWYYTPTDPADARRRIDAILERLRRGEDH